MNGVNSYGAYQELSYQNAVNSKNSSTRTNTANKSSRTQSSDSQLKLSDRAQELLEKLKKKYGDMDVMVAGKGDDPKEVLSRGTKEFSVLFSSEELEKMAADEKYEKKMMDRVREGMRMSEQINKKFGFGPSSSKGEITQIGVAFDSNGSATYFAGLEKMSDSQRDRIEQAKEQNKAPGTIRSKRTQVTASSMKELLEKMNRVDWSKIKEQDHTNHAYGLDYSI